MGAGTAFVVCMYEIAIRVVAFGWQAIDRVRMLDGIDCGGGRSCCGPPSAQAAARCFAAIIVGLPQFVTQVVALVRLLGR